MQITIRDVAQKAGVSISTASRALNDSKLISKSTKDKVKQVAQEMNYLPNYNARNLSLGQTNMVGVVSPIFSGDSSANLFQMDLIHAISQELNQKNYELVLITGKNQDELREHILKNYEQFKINNFIFLKDEIAELTIDTLKNYQINFVEIGHGKPDPEIYVESAKAMDLKPEQVAGLEDAQSGIESINGAGEVSIGFGKDLKDVDVKFTSTSQVSLDAIKNSLDK